MARMFSEGYDVEHLNARTNFVEAEEVERGIRKELARFPERRIRDDHRPHLGELNEENVARCADGRSGESQDTLKPADESEEERERDPYPEVDRPHEVWSHNRARAPFCHYATNQQIIIRRRRSAIRLLRANQSAIVRACSRDRAHRRWSLRPRALEPRRTCRLRRTADRRRSLPRTRAPVQARRRSLPVQVSSRRSPNSWCPSRGCPSPSARLSGSL